MRQKVKNVYGFLTLALAVAALLLLRNGQALHSTPTLFLAGLSGIAALFVSMFAHPRITSEERRRRLLLLFDIHRPEETRQKFFEAAAWLFSLSALRFCFCVSDQDSFCLTPDFIMDSSKASRFYSFQRTPFPSSKS
jgi:hypothetical protein